MNANDLSKVYGALLSSPGMTDQVKIDVKINRRSVLLLNNVIERSIGGKTDETGYAGLIEALPKEELQTLRDFARDCLEKAGLKELNEKLFALSAK